MKSKLDIVDDICVLIAIVFRCNSDLLIEVGHIHDQRYGNRVEYSAL